MKKIIFLDVDGTLVNYENKVPDSAIRAIRSARENGHRIYLCTGRSKSEMQPELKEIGFDGMIGGNGSYVEDHDKVIMHQALSFKQCSQIVDWLQKKGLEFFLESNDGLFASEGFEEKALPAVLKYIAGKGSQSTEPVDVRSAFPYMQFGCELYRENVNKISFILNRYQDFLDAREAFPDLRTGTWGGKDEEALFGDFGPKNITKAHAIHELLKYLHADVSQTAAIGDAKVDIPMLEYCAVGIAMGNGGTEIKAMADYITDDVNQDGLWKAFQYLGCIS